ncbi:relaxase/mobilization nuclease domain-containing protein [Aeromonas caviae]|uniref:relaxase/mobilization nuclease domain-containing protein n=1 Tax=Aeromonas caviae TaxID=648 RepID=UPI001F24C462|nr:relaxase/mobilization nuclease domain-containing protein [Aeromonas caviae]
MIVKFHARGVGRGSGPVGYLLGPDGAREGATLDRGDPALIEALIDSSPYAKKYTSGVLSFQEADLPREDKDKLMDSFERALLPGLDRDQYACLWVEHQDKGRLELNFVVPNVELLSGKRLQPYFDRADRPRIDAWKTVINAQLGLHDPDDPLNKRTLGSSQKTENKAR